MTAHGAGHRRKIPPTVLDVAIALAAVAAVFLAMFVYTGLWPPLVVVESKSMQHSATTSQIGTIDTGDLVLVKKVKNRLDIVTWLSGKQSGHQTYGAYGDVIVYKRGGSDTSTPIIHRTVMYLEANPNGASYRATELRSYQRNVDYSFENSSNTWERITGDMSIYDYGYDAVNIIIPVGRMISEQLQGGGTLHSGFITKGDFNSYVDQMMGMGFTSVPVPIDWVIGKARGEIPWFGIMKLWMTGTLPADTPSNSIRNLWITITLLVAAPVTVELALWWKARARGTRDWQTEIDAGGVTSETAPPAGPEHSAAEETSERLRENHEEPPRDRT